MDDGNVHKRYYTGIGSKQTPPNILLAMYKIARILNRHNFILRSGASIGADTAFEKGAGENKEIYLPWRYFNSHPSKLFTPSRVSYGIASRLHPHFKDLSRGAQALNARNVQQILGVNADTPSEFVICWTPSGKKEGDEGRTMLYAEHYGIPIYNLQNDVDVIKLWTLIEDIKNERA